MTDHAPPPPDETHLISLATRLREALALREGGKEKEASELLRQILLVDPRLAEPRLELAHIAAEKEDWEEAEAQARVAVDILRAGGQWTADVPPHKLLSFAVNLLGELVYRALQEGDLIFRDAAGFDLRWNEAAALFVEALRVDPENDDARYWTTHVLPRDLPEA